MADLGVIIQDDGNGHQTVSKAFTCPHCGRVNVLSKDWRHFCRKHMRPTCPTEACANYCDDMERVVERIEKYAAHVASRGY